MFYRLIILVVLLSCSIVKLNAQIKSSTKVAKQTCYKYDKKKNLVPCKCEKKTRKPQIVFAANDQTPFYNSAVAEEKIGNAKFLTPYFVIGKKESYYQLAEYGKDAIKKKGGIFSKIIFKKKFFTFEKPDKAKYMGWISEDQLLLNPTALKNSNNRYPMYIGGLSSMLPMDSIPNWIKKDSIQLFADSELKKKSKDKLKLNEIAYLYKKDSINHTLLIGVAPKMNPDSLPKTMGWIDENLVALWTDGVVLKHEPSSKDSCNSTLHTLTDSGENEGVKYDIDSLGTTNLRYQGIIPTIGDFKTNWNENQSGYTAPFPFDIIDRSENKVINVAGDVIKYPEYIKLKQEKKRVNILLLVEETKETVRQLKPLSNVLQSLYSVIIKNNQLQYKYSVLSYGAESTPRFEQSLQPEYARWLEYVNETVAHSEDSIPETSRPSFTNGLINACKVFKGKENETNIVIILGSQAISKDSSDLRLASYSLGRIGVRQIYYQVRNTPTAPYTNFVLYAKDLLYSSAKISTEYKKKYLLTYRKMPTKTKFKQHEEQEGNTYWLNYPAESLHQGGIIFPSVNTNNQPRQLLEVVDTVLRQIILENQILVQQFDSSFQLIGVLNNKLNPILKKIEKHYAEKIFTEARLSYTPLTLNLTFNPKDTANKDLCRTFSPNLIVTLQELEAIHNTLDLIKFKMPQKDKRKYRKRIKNKFLEIVNLKLKEKGIKSTISGKHTIERLLKECLEIPPTNLKCSKFKIRSIKNKRKFKQKDFKNLSEYLKKTLQNVKNILNSQQKFTSGKEVYYYLPKSAF